MPKGRKKRLSTPYKDLDCDDDNIASSLSTLTPTNNDNITKQNNDLIDTMKCTIKNEMHEIKELLNDLKLENARLRSEISDNKTEISTLKEVNKNLLQQLQTNEKRNNEMEMYSRRNSIRIFGVKEKVNETHEDCLHKIIDIFHQIKVKIESFDLDTFHRTGRTNSDRPRPIIVKFVRRLDRDMVLKTRRALRGTGISIYEDLTAKNHYLLKCAKDHPLVQSAWSHNGKIISILTNGKKLQLDESRSLEDQLSAPVINTDLKVVFGKDHRDVAVSSPSRPQSSIYNRSTNFTSPILHTKETRSSYRTRNNRTFDSTGDKSSDQQKHHQPRLPCDQYMSSSLQMPSTSKQFLRRLETDNSNTKSQPRGNNY